MKNPKLTLKFKRITADDLEYFDLDSPGYLIARDLIRPSEVPDVASIIEVICLANKVACMRFHRRVMAELEALGKSEEYEKLCGTEEGDDLLFATLGEAKIGRMMRQTTKEMRLEATPPTRTGRGQRRAQ